MARDPDNIERDIEQARDALASTLDELSTRAHPQRLVETGKHSVASTFANPKVRYALIGVGVLVSALVLRKFFR